jgi:hypothetical protein
MTHCGKNVTDREIHCDFANYDNLGASFLQEEKANNLLTIAKLAAINILRLQGLARFRPAP